MTPSQKQQEVPFSALVTEISHFNNELYKRGLPFNGHLQSQTRPNSDVRDNQNPFHHPMFPDTAQKSPTLLVDQNKRSQAILDSSQLSELAQAAPSQH